MKNITLFGFVLGLLFALSGTGFAQMQSISLATLSGDKISIDSQRGKIVILAVGATWLPLSKQQASITGKLAKKYAGRDVAVYFVATDSIVGKPKNSATDGQIGEFAAKYKVGATVLRDPDGAATVKRFKIDQLPSFVVLGKDGNPIGEPFGGVTPDAENDLINQISLKIDGLL